MKVTDIEGLYVATSVEDNFTILVAAEDTFNAKIVAENYFGDAGMDTKNIKVKEFADVNTNFNCDYIVY